MPIVPRGDKYDEPPTPPKRPTVLLLLSDIGNTTWRMFIPTIGGAVIGWWLDGKVHSTPWFGLGGLSLGIVVTAVLIKQQLNKVDNAK